MVKTSVKKVVLAYTGGLDSSVIVPWLKENYACEVVCFTANVGQGDEYDGLEAKALASGASQFIIRDLRDEFVQDFIFPVLRAGAVYERYYLGGTSMARPLIAKHQVEIAHEVGADAVAHGASARGNGQMRYELTFAALDPHLKVISPWREWEIRSREDEIAYARARNIPIDVTERSHYGRDANLWHLSHEGGPLGDPWKEPPESIFLHTVSPEEAPDEPVYLEIEFEAGSPVALNGEKMSPAKILAHLNALGGTHGIGRVDVVESRLMGMKSHSVYETPGGTILFVAHQELESIVLDRETMQYKDTVALKYAELVYNGMWFSPLREALDAFVVSTQDLVTGCVRLKLFKGNLIMAGRKSPFSLYREDTATVDGEDVINRLDGGGYIRITGLPLRLRALNKQARSNLDTPNSEFG
jgi:argininosuccinate synthase